jgi:hypothetical protein
MQRFEPLVAKRVKKRLGEIGFSTVPGFAAGCAEGLSPSDSIYLRYGLRPINKLQGVALDHRGYFRKGRALPHLRRLSRDPVTLALMKPTRRVLVISFENLLWYFNGFE